MCYRNTQTTGSPPQVRGKPDKQRPVRLKRRITPAGAGKTRPPTEARDSSRDHPRRCGENIYPEYGLKDETGSPPQVRGKLGEWEQRKPIYRITPAGAGKTGIPFSQLCSP